METQKTSRTDPPEEPITIPPEIALLDGAGVYVSPQISDSQNSVGTRGILRVISTPEIIPPYRLEIWVTYPDMHDMGGDPGRERIIPVPEEELPEIISSKSAGAYRYTFRSNNGAKRDILGE